MKKTIWIVIVVIIIGISIVFFSRSKGNSGIKIGIVAPLTGWGAYWGEGELKGIELAKKEIAIGGGAVEVTVEDGQTDAKQSASAAQKLISLNKVNAMGVEFTSPTSSVSPISEKNKIPLLYNAFIKNPLSSNSYAFKMYFDIEKECGVATKYFVDKGYKKIGALILNLDMGAECKRGISENLKNTNSTVVYYDFNVDVVDFRTIIAKMKEDKIDSLVTVAYEDNAIALFKQKAELKLNVPVFAAGGRPDNFNENIYKKLPAEILEGTITYDQNINPNFISKIKNIYPNITEKDLVSSAYGYDEVMYLYNALVRCPGYAPECVTAELIKETHHNPALDATGFGSDRILKLTPTYFMFTQGEFVKIKI